MQQQQVDGPKWTLGLWHMMAAITWLRQQNHTVCETRAEGYHLKSRGPCGITRGIVPTAAVVFDVLHKVTR